MPSPDDRPEGGQPGRGHADDSMSIDWTLNMRRRCRRFFNSPPDKSKLRNDYQNNNIITIDDDDEKEREILSSNFQTSANFKPPTSSSSFKINYANQMGQSDNLSALSASSSLLSQLLNSSLNQLIEIDNGSQVFSERRLPKKKRLAEEGQPEEGQIGMGDVDERDLLLVTYHKSGLPPLENGAKNLEIAASNSQKSQISIAGQIRELKRERRNRRRWLTSELASCSSSIGSSRFKFESSSTSEKVTVKSKSRFEDLSKNKEMFSEKAAKHLPKNNLNAAHSENCLRAFDPNNPPLYPERERRPNLSPEKKRPTSFQETPTCCNCPPPPEWPAGVGKPSANSSNTPLMRLDQQQDSLLGELSFGEVSPAEAEPSPRMMMMMQQLEEAGRLSTNCPNDHFQSCPFCLLAIEKGACCCGGFGGNCCQQNEIAAATSNSRAKTGEFNSLSSSSMSSSCGIRVTTNTDCSSNGEESFANCKLADSTNNQSESVTFNDFPSSKLKPLSRSCQEELCETLKCCLRISSTASCLQAAQPKETHQSELERGKFEPELKAGQLQSLLQNWSKTEAGQLGNNHTLALASLSRVGPAAGSGSGRQRSIFELDPRALAGPEADFEAASMIEATANLARVVSCETSRASSRLSAPPPRASRILQLPETEPIYDVPSMSPRGITQPQNRCLSPDQKYPKGPVELCATTTNKKELDCKCRQCLQMNALKLLLLSPSSTTRSARLRLEEPQHANRKLAAELSLTSRLALDGSYEPQVNFERRRRRPAKNCSTCTSCSCSSSAGAGSESTSGASSCCSSCSLCSTSGQSESSSAAAAESSSSELIELAAAAARQDQGSLSPGSLSQEYLRRHWRRRQRRRPASGAGNRSHGRHGRRRLKESSRPGGNGFSGETGNFGPKLLSGGQRSKSLERRRRRSGHYRVAQHQQKQQHQHHPRRQSGHDLLVWPLINRRHAKSASQSQRRRRDEERMLKSLSGFRVAKSKQTPSQAAEKPNLEFERKPAEPNLVRHLHNTLGGVKRHVNNPQPADALDLAPPSPDVPAANDADDNNDCPRRAKSSKRQTPPTDEEFGERDSAVESNLAPNGHVYGEEQQLLVHQLRRLLAGSRQKDNHDRRNHNLAPNDIQANQQVSGNYPRKLAGQQQLETHKHHQHHHSRRLAGRNCSRNRSCRRPKRAPTCCSLATTATSATCSCRHARHGYKSSSRLYHSSHPYSYKQRCRRYLAQRQTRRRKRLTGSVFDASSLSLNNHRTRRRRRRRRQQRRLIRLWRQQQQELDRANFLKQLRRRLASSSTGRRQHLSPVLEQEPPELLLQHQHRHRHHRRRRQNLRFATNKTSQLPFITSRRRLVSGTTITSSSSLRAGSRRRTNNGHHSSSSRANLKAMNQLRAMQRALITSPTSSKHYPTSKRADNAAKSEPNQQVFMNRFLVKTFQAQKMMEGQAAATTGSSNLFGWQLARRCQCAHCCLLEKLIQVDCEAKRAKRKMKLSRLAMTARDKEIHL